MGPSSLSSIYFLFISYILYFFLYSNPNTHSLGANALLLASRKGDKETCRVLMRGGIDTLRVQNDDPSAPTCDLTPLMVASYSGHESLVKFLITSCISDINEQSASLGVSSLMLATLAGHEVTGELSCEKCQKII